MYHLRTTRGKDDGEMQVAVIWSPMLYLLDTPSILGPYLGRSKIESRRRSHWITKIPLLTSWNEPEELLVISVPLDTAESIIL